MAQPHHRHQASLESVIDFSNTATSLSTERSQATLTFDRIINYSSHKSPKIPGDAGREYGRAKLIKLVYDHAISDAGRDNILRYFLTCLVTDSTELEEFPCVLSTGLEVFPQKRRRASSGRPRHAATNLARLPPSINPPIQCKGFAMSSTLYGCCSTRRCRSRAVAKTLS
jgi:hypothetical protein